ncbi:MAG: isocitrate lyase/PEP mutase family protein, partial [Ginsengibacter sp.]
MMGNVSQKEKADSFREFHHAGRMLLLPNIWDPLGAALLERLEYPAVATASASVAWANGYNDGENIPFNDLLLLLKKIVKQVDLPVTADIESGYADNDFQLQENMKLLIDAGIVGINIEDTIKRANKFLSAEIQSNRIRLIRKVSVEMGVPLFINARTDTYLHDEIFPTPELKLEETIKRGLFYKEAGADGFYPILMKQENEIKEIIDRVKLPMNVITAPGIPELKRLNNLGVARVSLG